jgi:NAD(P)-dependent dehydrogenase (short-subunit alcohol dehydrogenase family)
VTDRSRPALELGTFGITVNRIAPGPFLTDLPAAMLTEEQRQLIGNAEL